MSSSSQPSKKRKSAGYDPDQFGKAIAMRIFTANGFTIVHESGQSGSACEDFVAMKGKKEYGVEVKISKIHTLELAKNRRKFQWGFRSCQSLAKFDGLKKRQLVLLIGHVNNLIENQADEPNVESYLGNGNMFFMLLGAYDCSISQLKSIYVDYSHKEIAIQIYIPELVRMRDGVFGVLETHKMWSRIVKATADPKIPDAVLSQALSWSRRSLAITNSYRARLLAEQTRKDIISTLNNLDIAAPTVGELSSSISEMLKKNDDLQRTKTTSTNK